MSKKKGFGKFLAGALVGATLGVLFAPRKGSDTRKQLKLKFDELVESIKNIDSKEVKENFEKKIKEIKNELANLDKEKALEIAKKKAKQIQTLAQDLVEYAVEKGTPVVEKAANNVRLKAIDVTKDILKKLEQEDK